MKRGSRRQIRQERKQWAAVDKIGEAIAEWQQLSVSGGDEEEAELGCEEEWRFVLARREG